METKGFPPLNAVQRYRIRILFPPCLPCRGAHFSSLAQVANISRKAAGSQRREGANLATTGEHWGVNVASVWLPASSRASTMGVI